MTVDSFLTGQAFRTLLEQDHVYTDEEERQGIRDFNRKVGNTWDSWRSRHRNTPRDGESFLRSWEGLKGPVFVVMSGGDGEFHALMVHESEDRAIQAAEHMVESDDDSSMEFMVSSYDNIPPKLHDEVLKGRSLGGSEILSELKPYLLKESVWSWDESQCSYEELSPGRQRRWAESLLESGAQNVHPTGSVLHFRTWDFDEFEAGQALPRRAVAASTLDGQAPSDAAEGDETALIRIQINPAKKNFFNHYIAVVAKKRQKGRSDLDREWVAQILETPAEDLDPDSEGFDADAVLDAVNNLDIRPIGLERQDGSYLVFIPKSEFNDYIVESIEVDP